MQIVSLRDKINNSYASSITIPDTMYPSSYNFSETVTHFNETITNFSESILNKSLPVDNSVHTSLSNDNSAQSSHVQINKVTSEKLSKTSFTFDVSKVTNTELEPILKDETKILKKTDYDKLITIVFYQIKALNM
jgi:hypothetical protein